MKKILVLLMAALMAILGTTQAMAYYLEITPGGNVDVRVYYITQQGMAPPTFIAFVNHPKQIQESYKRFVENHLRREFGFAGTPVRILFRRNRRGGET